MNSCAAIRALTAFTSFCRFLNSSAQFPSSPRRPFFCFFVGHFRGRNGGQIGSVKGAGSGVVLVDLDDIDTAINPACPVNGSARNLIATVADILISDFVVEGSVARTVLVRGVGPALHDSFTVTTSFTDPKMETHQLVGGQDRVLAANDN